MLVASVQGEVCAAIHRCEEPADGSAELAPEVARFETVADSYHGSGALSDPSALSPQSIRRLGYRR